MYSFPSLEPVCCSMSSSNCCSLNCLRISQEADKVVWYSHFLKNFPQFAVIYTVKGFGVISKAEVDVFLEFSCFFYDPLDVDNFISGSSAFLKSSLNIWKFMVHITIENWLREFWALICWRVRWMQWWSGREGNIVFNVLNKGDSHEFKTKATCLT